MNRKSYATQIWPFREDFGRDMPGTLEKISLLGFSGVELCRWFDWTNMFDKWTAEEIHNHSNKVGLQIVSSHIPYSMILADRLDELTDFCQIVGMEYAIVASLPDDAFTSNTKLEDVSAAFNKAADILSPRGIRTGYHCHGDDFIPVDNGIPWEIIFDNTNPEIVMQLDIGNSLQGNADPVYYLNKYPGRAALIHLKEYHPQIPPAAIGDGVVNWSEVLSQCEKLHKPSWYIIEQEEEEYDPWFCAERSLEYLHAIGW